MKKIRGPTNANLNEAAPAMLATLQYVRDRLGILTDFLVEKGYFEEATLTHAEYVLVDKTIQKATGQLSENEEPN